MKRKINNICFKPDGITTYFQKGRLFNVRQQEKKQTNKKKRKKQIKKIRTAVLRCDRSKIARPKWKYTLVRTFIMAGSTIPCQGPATTLPNATDQGINLMAPRTLGIPIIVGECPHCISHKNMLEHIFLQIYCKPFYFCGVEIVHFRHF